ncbi:MAG: hypothetical protein R2882_12160 [Gemmatimonadales bacterium]
MPALARRLPARFDPASSAAPALEVASSRSEALRRLLGEKFPDAVLLPDRAAEPIPTGLAVFDQLLPGGGLPRGRMTVWKSPIGGATALLRSSIHSLSSRGERTCWIDGKCSLATEIAAGTILVRPATEALALTAAEILLRSGGFALIVLSGVAPDQHGMLRLSRMVHEGGGAFVALTEKSLTASLRLTSRFLLDRFRWTTGPFGDVAAVESVALEVTASAPGWSRSQVLTLPARTHDFRLSLDPGLADRRGDLG